MQDQTELQVASPQSKQSPDRAMAHRGRKRVRPLASAPPKPDLSPHGMLEQPRRYDPSSARRKGGVPNPRAGELHHDHFQELDRNRDGVIDPFERVSGRLDIDRDLSNRQWE
ncbi:MAG: EF-hand domain-containing protein [Nitrospiraceae bacterium]